MKNYSIWQDNVKIKKYPILLSDEKCDVLIIGGGITGVSVLYHSKNTNFKTILVEQNKIGMGTTSRSTGKLSFLQNDLLDKIRTSVGDNKTKLYLDSQIEAIKLVKDIIKKENISCNLEKVNSVLYTNKDSEINELRELNNFLSKCNIKTNDTTSSLVKSKYMFEVSDTYLFHPMKFVSNLIKNLDNIYENTSIKKIIKENDYYLCYTDKVKIKAKYVIIASHYPYFNLPFMFPIKASLEKSYLSASKYLFDKVSLISYSNPFISIRTYQDYLIYLSNSHSINKDTCDKKHFNELLKKLNDLKLKPDYLWSNIDILTNDGLPYIGKIDNNLLIATGYNTWGLATGVLAGKIISDILLKKENKYIDLFDPKRSNLEQIIGGVSNTYKSISGYVNGMMHSKNKKTCTHMGCKLIYNEIENTYDCPCHGSRFNKDGEVIIAPANKKLK